MTDILPSNAKVAVYRIHDGLGQSREENHGEVLHFMSLRMYAAIFSYVFG
jgi:hypothetical protein